MLATESCMIDQLQASLPGPLVQLGGAPRQTDTCTIRLQIREGGDLHPDHPHARLFWVCLAPDGHQAGPTERPWTQAGNGQLSAPTLSTPLIVTP